MNNDSSLSSFLKPEEIAAIQSRLMHLLSEDILKFTNNQSSSVPSEKAQSLFESMLYCITAYLNTLPDAASALKTRDLEELYVCGLNLIKQYVEESMAILLKVKATRVKTDLFAYNSTIDDGFHAFFKSYDPRFNAQDTVISADYPLLKDDRSITGILYIKNYLTELLKENEFCAKYSKNFIRGLLLTYGVKYHLDYREILINIPELILEHNNKDLKID